MAYEEHEKLIKTLHTIKGKFLLMEIGVAAVALALTDDEACQQIVSHCDQTWLVLAADELNREEAARLLGI